MNIPFFYILKNFYARRLSASITVSLVALVVFAFTFVLMMAYGVEKALVSTGSKENAIMVRKGASAEISSIIERETARNFEALPGIAKSADGKPLLTAEVATVINLEKIGGGMSNISVRGVGVKAAELRKGITIKQGRMFQVGARELVVGSAVPKRFNGANIGDKIKFSGDAWVIVGVMDCGGSAFDSELWADCEQLLQANNRTAYSSLTFRFTSRDDLESMKASMATDPRLNQMELFVEQDYFQKQSEALALFLRILGLVITIISSVGAMIGAMITMYSSVANRTTEIGTLRALGFRRSSVLLSFLFESLLLSLVGGGIGIFVASFMQFFSMSTINFSTFSDITFSFALNPTIVLSAIIFTLVMGIVGGFLPAWGASRLKIVDALRAS